MIKYYILLFFTIYAHAHYWDSLKIIEDNIDDDIDPCDDFYRHMCARNKPEETTWSRLLHKAYYEEIDDIVKKNIPDKLSELMAQGYRIIHSGYSVVPLKVLQENYVEICQKNSTEALFFLQTLESFFGREATEPCWGYLCFTNLAMDSDCQQASETLAKGANTLLNRLKINSAQNVEYLQRTYNNKLASMWSLLHQDEFKRVHEMFTFFKEELLKSIQKTPWLLNSNTMEVFYNITSRMRLNLQQKEIKETFNNILTHQLSYDTCVNTFSSLGIFANEYCVLYSLPKYKEKHDLTQANAFNKHPEIMFMNQYVSTLSDNGSIALKYGSVGAILGHEMGHSVIMSDLSDGFYPYYSKEINPCVQQQFNETCNVFKEGSCEVQENQVDENGSDIFGFQFAYDRLKQIMGDKINEKIAESKRNMTNAQGFFYAVFPGGCQRGDVYAPKYNPFGHGANNVRVNARVIQVPDFGKVFNCSKNSRMMLSKTKQCHIFGESAPQH